MESLQREEIIEEKKSKNVYEVISRVAFLSGVPLAIFENEHEPPRLDIYKVLEENKAAVIVRKLCLLRNQLEQNFNRIKNGIQNDGLGLLTMPELISTEALDTLRVNGIDIASKPEWNPIDYIIKINKNIENRINNCKGLFPEWIDWSYIRSLFVMPAGGDRGGAIAAAKNYYEHRECYPYSVYLNLKSFIVGNILYNDKVFVEFLYKQNNVEFSDSSKVEKEGASVVANIKTFLDNSERCVIIVDCENSDPYRLSAAINNMEDDFDEKISKIILIDDVNTGEFWQNINLYMNIPTEYILVERINEHKSIVDMRIGIEISREYYENKTDSFVLFSSDSDFYSVMEALPQLNFLVMLEREKTGNSLKNALHEAGIRYCYINDFYTGFGQDLKEKAVYAEIGKELEDCISINIRGIVEDVCKRLRVNYTFEEQRNIYNKVVKKLTLEVNEKGDVVLSSRN